MRACVCVSLCSKLRLVSLWGMIFGAFKKYSYKTTKHMRVSGHRGEQWSAGIVQRVRLCYVMLTNNSLGFSNVESMRRT